MQGRSQHFEKGGAFLFKRAELANHAAGGMGEGGCKPLRSHCIFGALLDDLSDFREHPPTNLLFIKTNTFPKTNVIVDQG